MPSTYYQNSSKSPSCPGTPHSPYSDFTIKHPQNPNKTPNLKTSALLKNLQPLISPFYLPKIHQYFDPLAHFAVSVTIKTNQPPIEKIKEKQ